MTQPPAPAGEIPATGLRNRLWQGALQRLAEGVDQAFTQLALSSPREAFRTDPASHVRRMTMLEGIAHFYGEAARDPSTFLPHPEPIAPTERRIRSFGRRGRRGEVIDLCWPSRFVPLWPDDVRRKYLAQHRNARAHARWIRHGDRPRPTVVLLHGYMGGNMLVEERVWPVARWFSRGMDVVLSCLPFHGARSEASRRLTPPRFPGNDPRFTVEGFRQVVFDHQALFGYLLNGHASSVGMMGMSLGGYSTTLLATLERRLTFAVPVIPLCSIAMFAHACGRLPGDGAQQKELRAALEAAQRSVDPLARPPVVEGERTVVIGGRCDRVTPIEHARRIAQHLGGPLVTFEGGHLLQTGRAHALKRVEHLFDRLQL